MGARIAQHGEADTLQEFMESLEIEDPKTAEDLAQSARELAKDFAQGAFLTPKGAAKKHRQSKRPKK
jgi:hypothetical protein